MGSQTTIEIKQGSSITVIGDYVGQLKIDKTSESASVPDDTEPDNKVNSRALIVTKDACKGNDPNKLCGDNGYDLKSVFPSFLVTNLKKVCRL